MLKKILVGLDGSAGSFKAFEEALSLASLAKIELHTLSVEDVPRFPGTIGEVVDRQEAADMKFGEAIAKAKEMADRNGVKLKPNVLMGHEVATIVEFLRENQFDLLVIGFMGHSAVYARVMGGTCQNLVRLAPCAILVVK